jgi:ribose-phosphate pyrophosphokinase
MVDTAGTITKCADMLIERGALSVRAVCTHAVLSGNAYDKISKSAIKEFIVTDTIPLKDDPDTDTSKFTVLSVAETFADVIDKVYNYKPISDTFVF